MKLFLHLLQKSLQPTTRKNIRGKYCNLWISKIVTTVFNEILVCNRQSQDADLRVDYVQVRRVAEITDIKALVFSASAALAASAESHIRVAVKVDTKNEEILESTCEQCVEKG